MKFNPNNAQPKPTGDYALLKPGVCDFKVIDAEEIKGKYGEYISVTLRVRDNGNEGNTMKDEDKLKSNVSCNIGCDEKGMWKLKEFMVEIGKEDEFNSGDVEASLFIKARGKLMLQHKEYLSKKDGEIKVGNHVASFEERKTIPSTWTLDPSKANRLTPVKPVAQKTQGQDAGGFDDDVPF